jgi:hypothetical protein
LSETSPFSYRVAVGLVVLGGVVFLLLLVLAAIAPEIKRSHDNSADVFSRSAIGYSGLADILRRSGAEVRINRGDLAKSAPGGGLLIVTPEPNGRTMPETFAHTGPVLIVAPKWQASADQLHPGWVGEGQTLSPEEAILAVQADKDSKLDQTKDPQTPMLRGSGNAFDPETRIPLARIERFQTMLKGQWIPELQDEQGRPVLLRDTKRTIYVLTDPDLMNNQGVAHQLNARAAVGIIDALRGYDGPIIFDVSSNGYLRTRNFLLTLFNAPLASGTIALIAAVVVFGFGASVRFGPATARGREIALGKTALVDNSAGLIRLAGRTSRMGDRYVAMTRRLAARALGLRRDLSNDELDRLFDRMSDKQTPRFTQEAAAARRASDEASLLAAARALHAWRLETTRERH